MAYPCAQRPIHPLLRAGNASRQAGSSTIRAESGQPWSRVTRGHSWSLSSKSFRNEEKKRESHFFLTSPPAGVPRLTRG